MAVLIVTNIILAVVIVAFVILELIAAIIDNRPIIIKEAEALRRYYEEKLKDAEKEAEEAKGGYIEYEKLYERELQKNRETDDIASRNSDLKLRVNSLKDELSSCEGRIEAMAQENEELKKKIKALSKPTNKAKKEEK